MSISNVSRHTLSAHYADLGDLRRDFRNYNLAGFIASKVKGTTVLDIGCGSGFLLDMLKAQGKIVWGIEPLPEMIALANKHFPGLTIYQGFAEDLEKLAPFKVDTVIMTDVLEHIEDDEVQLRKIHDALNEDGKLVLVVPAYPFLYGKRDKNMGHFRRYSCRHLRRLFAETGFAAEELRYWNMLGFIPYFIYEKIFGKELRTNLRTPKTKGLLGSSLNWLLHRWFQLIENNFNLGFGLSLVCVANKKVA